MNAIHKNEIISIEEIQRLESIHMPYINISHSNVTLINHKIAQCFQTIKKFDLAEEYYEKAVLESKYDSRIYYDYANMEYELKNYSLALNIAEKSYVYSKHYGMGVVLLIKISIKLQDQSRALHYLNELCRIRKTLVGHGLKNYMKKFTKEYNDLFDAQYVCSIG